MCPHVSGHMAWLVESYLTHFTFERFLSCMCPHVNCQIAWRRESFLAYFTFVRLISCMCPHVNCQMAWTGESMMTHFTFVRFLSRNISNAFVLVFLNGLLSIIKFIKLFVTVCCTFTHLVLLIIDYSFQMLRRDDLAVFYAKRANNSTKCVWSEDTPAGWVLSELSVSTEWVECEYWVSWVISSEWVIYKSIILHWFFVG